MANPTRHWDGVPVFGVWMRAPGDTPESGPIRLKVANRIQRVDGRIVYPAGASVLVTIGEQADQDPDIRSAVRAAWRAADEAADGVDFDGVAWDTWWDTKVVPAAIFTRFPALDDPDLIQDEGNRVMVSEQLTSASGREYAIQPLLAHLDLPIPGVNLGAVVVPPGSPTVPAPVYAKGIPGGVAGLDADGDVVDASGTKVGTGGGASTVQELTDATDVGKALVTAQDAATARDAIGAVAGDDARLGDQRVPTDGSVTLAKLTAALQASIAKADASLDQAAVDARVQQIVDAAPAALDTLNELAAALGDDPNFAASVTTALAGKASLSGGKVPIAQIPTGTSSSTVLLGSWRPGWADLQGTPANNLIPQAAVNGLATSLGTKATIVAATGITTSNRFAAVADTADYPGQIPGGGLAGDFVIVVPGV